MSLTVFIVVLGAALLHASWNGLVKHSQDKYLSISAIVLGHVPFAAVNAQNVKPKPLLEPEKLSLKKSCKNAYSEFDGLKVVGWKCVITVVANPAPFSGSFTFTEDASAITGAAASNIVAISPSNWQCTPDAPTSVTTCTISGAKFSPRGFEIVTFNLFAPFTGPTIVWKNCVDGFYENSEGKKKPLKGNCETETWKPQWWHLPG